MAPISVNAFPISQVAETLTAGIQDITNAMVEDFKLSDVLRMILETMLQGAWNLTGSSFACAMPRRR